MPQYIKDHLFFNPSPQKNPKHMSAVMKMKELKMFVSV